MKKTLMKNQLLKSWILTIRRIGLRLMKRMSGGKKGSFWNAKVVNFFMPFISDRTKLLQVLTRRVNRSLKKGKK